VSGQNAYRPLVSIGLNWYPGGVHILPYTFGVRLPYDNPPDGSAEQTYNAGYEQGAYDSSWRVGLGGLALGAVVGYLLFRRR